MGNHLAAHLTEGYWAIVLGAAYVYITVTAGFPLCVGIWGQLARAFLADELQEEASGIVIGTHLISFFDANLYIFLAIILATFHRWRTGRRLWTRYTARTIVICDATMNYKLLRAYLSKLRALAWRFTTFGVAGQNPCDHFVHEMTHLANSDVILVVGRQDGRIASLAAAEASTIMSVQQARFISANECGGVEALSVGHNKWEKPGLFSKAVALPTAQRLPFLSEKLLNTWRGSHAPGTVMHHVASIAAEGRKEGSAKEAPKARGGQGNLVPWVSMDELLDRFDGRKIVPTETAIEVMSDIIVEQAERCGIWKATAAEEFQKFAASHAFFQDFLTHTPSTPSRRKTAGWMSPRGLLPRFSLDARAVVSASQVMAILRRRKVADWLADLRRKTRQRELLEQGGCAILAVPGGDSSALLRKVWLAWTTHFLKQKKSEDLTFVRHFTPFSLYGANFGDRFLTDANAAPLGEWRKAEELRRNGKKHLSSIGLSLKTIFAAWRRVTIADRAVRVEVAQPTKLDVGSECVGARLAEQCAGVELLAELRIVEGLYESRVAAAERLISFFVIFYTAVRPLSRLPMWSFNMDRSESRLRVASTPAPVSFCEALPAIPAYLMATLKLQAAFRRRLRKQCRIEVDESKKTAETTTPTSEIFQGFWASKATEESVFTAFEREPFALFGVVP